jgi:Icc-related predicted phosphoesterase
VPERRPRTALCLADLHSNVTALGRLDRLLADASGRLSAVLIAGDVTVPGHERYARDVVELVRRHGVPLLLVHGNNDTLEAVEEFRRAGVTIHRREREVDGVRYVGFGGDGSAPYDLQLGPGETLDLHLEGAVLLTHVPPPGLRYGPDRPGAPPPPPAAGLPFDPALPAPRAQLCGHVHATEGVAWLGRTKVIKLRAAMWNRCALLDLERLAPTFRPLDPRAPLAPRVSR